jgi:hypothetical protein
VPTAAGAVPPQEVDAIGNTTNDTTIEVDNPEGPGTIEINTAGDQSPTGGGSSCSYTVRGRLTVSLPSIDGLSLGEPIKGVKVKVSGRSSAGWYKEWDTRVTNKDGEFSVLKSECSDRKIKIEARFESDDLRVKGPGSPGWYKLHETSGTISPRTLDLGVESFGPAGDEGDQGTSQARTDAQTWMVAQRAIERLAAIDYPFLNKVTIHNPATLTGGRSATDPLLDDIHIDPNETADLHSLLHELGHAWLYPRVSAEGCLTFDAVLSGSTHDFQEDPCIAFNEGFADFFSRKLEQDLAAESLLVSSSFTTVPMSRAYLQSIGLISLARLEGNEIGWDQVFRVLTAPDLTRYLLGGPLDAPTLAGTYDGPPCSGQPTSLGDLDDALRAIGSNLNVSSINVLKFLEHANDRLSALDSRDAGLYYTAINPTFSTEPHASYGC